MQTTAFIDTLQWHRKTTFPRLELTIPQYPCAELSNSDKRPGFSGVHTPETPTTEPLSMPLIDVLPTPGISQSVTVEAEIHAHEEEEFNTPIITPLGMPLSPLVDRDDWTEMLVDKTKTELVDANSATEDILLWNLGRPSKNPAYRIFQTEYSGCLDISAHA